MRHAALINGRHFSLGLLVLFLGIALYATVRPDPVLLLPNWLHSGQLVVSLPSNITGSLPSFIHVAAFSLFTVAVLRPGRLGLVTTCISWALVDLIFEIGQHPAVAAMVVSATPEFVRGFSAMRYVIDFLQAGTFDPFDLAAIVLGASVLLLYLTHTQGDSSQ